MDIKKALRRVDQINTITVERDKLMAVIDMANAALRGMGK